MGTVMGTVIGAILTLLLLCGVGYLIYRSSKNSKGLPNLEKTISTEAAKVVDGVEKKL